MFVRLSAPAFFLVLALVLGPAEGSLFAVGAPAQTAFPDPPGVESEILPNGIRVSRVFRPDLGDQVEIAFGYRTPMDAGLQPPGGAAAALVGAYLEVSVPARTVALATHYAGGTFEPIRDAGRIGMRLRVPRRNASAVARRIARYFSHVIINYDVLEYVREELETDGAFNDDGPSSTIAFDDKTLEAQSRLLGTPNDGPSPSEESSSPDLSGAQAYLDRNLGTDRAWIVISGAQPRIDLSEFRNVVFRAAESEPDSGEGLAAERIDVQFDSEPEGGVILATLVPSPYYQSWFGAVVMDEILRESADSEMRFAFPLRTGESVHVMRTPVRIPDYAEDVRDRWLNLLMTMIYEPLAPERINAIKTRTLERLGDPVTVEWFAAQGLASAFTNGWAAIRDLGPDQLRVFASNFYSARRVAAVWAPAFSQPVAVVEELTLSAQPESVDILRETRPVPGRLPALGAVAEIEDVPGPIGLARLDSGITLAEGDAPMVWVGGPLAMAPAGGRIEASSPNGTLVSFPPGTSVDVETLFSGIRAGRLLLFFPPAELPAARSRFASWEGGAADTSANPLIGEFATIDIPTVVVLKMWLEARIIEAGWWNDARVTLAGTEGARMLIEADPDREDVIRQWIGEAARGEIGEDAFRQARRAAIEHFPRLRTDLQIILWQRAPDGSIPPPVDVSPEMLRVVAERYF